MTDERTWEHQRRTFERTAEDYERYRPGYPDELFDDLRNYAALARDDRILEIGCGPGKASVPIARWGHRLLCLEPSAPMVSVARRNLSAFPNVDFETCTFEDWDLEPGAFGLVAVAQAFHWLDPHTRVQRIRAALRVGGTAARIDNAQVTPPEHMRFFVKVQDVYHAHAPELAHKGEFRTHLSRGHDLEAEQGFTDHERRDYAWEWTLSTGEYVALLSTHSDHAALADDARRRLLDGIAELIDIEFSGCVTQSYFAVLQLARRAP